MNGLRKLADENNLRNEKARTERRTNNIRSVVLIRGFANYRRFKDVLSPYNMADHMWKGYAGGCSRHEKESE